MKNRIIYLLFLITFSTFGVFAQQNSVKFQFGVFSENGNFFSDLKASDIQIMQAKKSLQAATFELKTEIPLEIVIMIDASVSQEKMLPDEKKAAEYFIDNVLKKGKDKVAIFSFTGKISLVQDLTDDFAKAKEELGKIKIELPPGYVGGGIVAGIPAKSPDFRLGTTSLWDSVKQVSEAAAKLNASNSRKAIMLITDGVNTFGEAKLQEAVESSIKNRVPIYAIGIGDDWYGGVDVKTLKKITGRTNGALIVQKKKLEDLLQQIKKFEQALRSFYEVTFSPNPTNSKDSLQETEIEIINPAFRKQKLQIIQPQGFFLQN